MTEKTRQKLIILTGSPCVGKTTIADSLFCLYENSAHLDDDRIWRVNPFSFDDPRNDAIYTHMSFILSSYLNLGFDYVILSSVRMIGDGRDTLQNSIPAANYMTIGFTLTCSEKTLTERHRQRGDSGDVSFKWLHKPPYSGDFVIDTDDKSVEQIAREMKNVIDAL